MHLLAPSLKLENYMDLNLGHLTFSPCTPPMVSLICPGLEKHRNVKGPPDSLCENFWIQAQTSCHHDRTRRIRLQSSREQLGSCGLSSWERSQDGVDGNWKEELSNEKSLYFSFSLLCKGNGETAACSEKPCLEGGL